MKIIKEDKKNVRGNVSFVQKKHKTIQNTTSLENYGGGTKVLDMFPSGWVLEEIPWINRYRGCSVQSHTKCQMSPPVVHPNTLQQLPPYISVKKIHVFFNVIMILKCNI